MKTITKGLILSCLLVGLIGGASLLQAASKAPFDVKRAIAELRQEISKINQRLDALEGTEAKTEQKEEKKESKPITKGTSWKEIQEIIELTEAQGPEAQIKVYQEAISKCGGKVAARACFEIGGIYDSEDDLPNALQEMLIYYEKAALQDDDLEVAKDACRLTVKYYWGPINSSSTNSATRKAYLEKGRKICERGLKLDPTNAYLKAELEQYRKGEYNPGLME